MDATPPDAAPESVALFVGADVSVNDHTVLLMHYMWLVLNLVT
jgi:hypothetical protein